MSQPIIEIKGIGKKYIINHQRGRYITLREVLMNVIRSPLQHLKRKVKKIAGLEVKEEFWALSDITLNVKKGEIVGIIGPNGAGKSTLLKILSQITPPTTGEIRLRGRVGSLLEVGTGFHPELTGRENIFLNGAILGMKKKEIAKKFDDIVQFAGIDKFLDTAVKYYSSGMYVRLAFSVAAHMEPDILVVDEVLAVGDAEFQKKCLGKMEEVTKQDGRTIIFVSHNMAAIERLCSSVILLEKGKVINIGPTRQIIDEYINKVFVSDESELILPKKENTPMSFSKISILNSDGNKTNKIIQNEDYLVNLEFETFKKTDGVDISVSLRNSRNTVLTFSSLSDIVDGKLKSYDPGKYTTQVKFKGGFLMPDTYFIRISIHHPGTVNIDTREDVFGFTVLNVPGQRPINYSVGAVSLPSEWTTPKI